MRRPTASIVKRPGRTCTRSLPSASNRAGSGLTSDSGTNSARSAWESRTSWLFPEATSSMRVVTVIGTSSRTSRLTRASSRSAPPSALDGSLSHRRPVSSRTGAGACTPFTVNETSPTDGGSRRLSGISLQENEPVSAWRPAGRRTPGRSCEGTTGIGRPATLTSRGQCFASPGSGIHSVRKTDTSCEKVAPCLPATIVRREGQLHWRVSPSL